MFKKIMTVLTITLTAFTFGCNRVTVEPAQLGKVLSPSGYSNEVLVTGKYTLGMREELVILDTATNTYAESMNVILSDKLTLTFDVKYTGRIRKDTKVINAMFNDITHGGDYKIMFQEVYSIYGQPKVRNISREVMSKYTVEDVHANYSRISEEINVALLDAFKGTPIELSSVALGDIRYPDVVTNAVSEAKKRNMEIEKEVAQAKIELLKKENELTLIKADYEIEMTKARTVADANKVMGESVTPALLELKRIEVSKVIAGNSGKQGNTVYMPVESLTSSAAQIKMYNK